MDASLRRCVAAAVVWSVVPVLAAAQPSRAATVRAPIVRADSAALARAALLRNRAALDLAPQRATVAGVVAAQPSAAPPAAISRARLQTVLGSASALRVVRAAGVTDLAGSADSVRIRPGEFVFRKTANTALRVPARDTAAGTPAGRPDPSGVAAAAPEVAGAATFSMPYRWLTVDSAGVERVLVPFFIVVGGGLTYDAATHTYRGVALVGVEDALHPDEGPVTLPRPLRLQLTTTRGGSVEPLQLAIGHTSLDYERVSITADDSTDVRIRTGADPAGIVIGVPVRAITVALVPQQRTLPALGLSTTDVTVSLPVGFARTDSATVSFHATGAPVRPASVLLTGTSVATVRLRSGMPGPDTVRAFVNGVPAGEMVVVFEPPWAFAAATLVGIVLGGTARFVSAKRRKRARALGWDVVKGAPFGILAAAAGAVGLDWLQLRIDDPGTWIAIMITAALGAWLASRVMQRALPVAA